MAYVQSKVMKKRLQDKRRVSGAALLREELNMDGDSSSLLDGLPAFQQNKGVMMANFEEWIKMATDNKINSTNSWNFALIDYFHDLNVLREKDNNINFQKASATLDGCVKIYSSRVDSVATETGRLLSGLATRKKEEALEEEGDDEDGKEDGEEDEEKDSQYDDDDGLQTKKKKSQAKAKHRELGDTLVTFDSIRVKKLSLELAIDPLFKKTLAEFDEGGAKSLLLNTLHMDKSSRVVFDASTTNANAEDGTEGIEEDREVKYEDVEMSGIENDLDIAEFKSFLFNDEADLDNLVVCPSFGHLESVLKDINKAKSILNDVNLKNSDIPDFSQNNGFDDNEDQGFDYDFGGNNDDGNSHGELDNDAAAIIFQDELRPNQEEVESNETGVVASVVDQDLMAYFDSTLKRTWAGPDHWKIRQLKKDKQKELQAAAATSAGPPTKKVKESFSIDFLTGVDEDEEEKKIFNKGKATTTLPQDQWESKDSNLLPDDLYFSSEQLTKLFLKPKEKLNIFRRRVNVRSTSLSQEPDERREVDATFWAENYEQQQKSKVEEADNPFYEDNGDDDGFDYDFGDDGFADFGFGSDENNTEEKTNFGTQLITGGTRVKPEYLNYSKKAKNVNIKVLKDNLWKVLETDTHKKQTEKEEPNEAQFSEIVKDIGKLYPKEEKKELSTSFCFICLLHLANEHSLTLENNETLTDLKIVNPK